MCPWWEVHYESDDLFLGSDQWLYICCIGPLRPPDGDLTDEVGVCLAVVELFHDVGWEELVCVSETVDGWSQLFDDVDDCLGVLEAVLDDNSEQLCFGVLCQRGPWYFCFDCELDLLVFWLGPRVEDGVVGFGRIWD